MIRKIQSIDNFRIFKGWVADSTTPDFEKINLLYGVNGSGKSTIASLLAYANQDVAWESGLSLTAEERTGVLVNVQSHDDSLWKKIHVFNRQFIEENLKFDSEGLSVATPLLTLGKKSIDRDQQLSVANAILVDIDGEQPKAEARLQRVTQLQERLAKDTADRIVQEFGKLGNRYNPRTYDVRNVKLLLNGELESVDDAFVERNLELIRTPKYLPLVTPETVTFSVGSIKREVTEILARSVTARVIESLRNNKSRSEWVQRGLDLHSSGDSCAFCDNIVTEERIQELTGHFDVSVKLLQGDIKNVNSSIEVLRNDVKGVLAGLPKESEMMPEIRDEYVHSVNAARSHIKNLEAEIEGFSVALAAKEGNPFSVVVLPTYDLAFDALDLTDIVALIERNNAVLETLDKRILEAAQQVEISWIASIKEQHEDYSRELIDLASQLEVMKIKRAEATSTIAKLLEEDLDPSPLAEAINSDLAALLGRQELTFRSVGKSSYLIERAGSPALFLSEGEKTIISLLYFIKSLGAHDSDGRNSIVIIDDPISSLDANFAVGLSSYLWSRLVGKDSAGFDKCAQLFLLTHNFELFRAWSNLLYRLGEGVRKTQGITESTQELRVRAKMDAAGEAIWQPYFYEWPNDEQLRKRIRSEYHYLFWRVATALKDCKDNPSPEIELDAAAVLPNVCRRLLEGFLSFKFPGEIGDFRKQMIAAIELMDQGVTRTLIVTYLHQYSHNEDGDTGKVIARPESVGVLDAVFDLIEFIDKDHYDKMFKALDLPERAH